MEKPHFLQGNSYIFKQYSKFNKILLNICDTTNIHFHYFRKILFQQEKRVRRADNSASYVRPTKQKQDNVRIMQHWGAFMQQLLRWKTMLHNLSVYL
jgi:uncharacterized membrane protein